MRAGTFSLWLGVVATLAGCGNPCESVCDQMATFARECGFTVPQGEVDQCVQDQSSQPADQRRICREFGDQASIEQSWDCLEVARYFPEQIEGDTPQ